MLLSGVVSVGLPAWPLLRFHMRIMAHDSLFVIFDMARSRYLRLVELG